jgi:hypothetical protein
MSRYIFFYISLTDDAFDVTPHDSLIFTQDSSPENLKEKITQILKKYEFSYRVGGKMSGSYDIIEASTVLVSEINDWKTKLNWKAFGPENLVKFPFTSDAWLWPYNFHILVTDKMSFTSV